ncbi:MAG: hypothetical protein WCR27_03675 [Eubacteriales bacterium]
MNEKTNELLEQLLEELKNISSKLDKLDLTINQTEQIHFMQCVNSKLNTISKLLKKE